MKLQPDITTFFKPANLNSKQQEQVTNNTKHKITKITGNKITKSNKNPKENPKTVEKRRGYWTNLAKKKKEQEETKKQEDEIVKIRDENNSSDNNLSDQSAQLLQVPGREGSTTHYNLADYVTGDPKVLEHSNLNYNLVKAPDLISKKRKQITRKTSTSTRTKD